MKTKEQLATEFSILTSDSGTYCEKMEAQCKGRFEGFLAGYEAASKQVDYLRGEINRLTNVIAEGDWEIGKLKRDYDTGYNQALLDIEGQKELELKGR